MIVLCQTCHLPGAFYHKMKVPGSKEEQTFLVRSPMVRVNEDKGDTAQYRHQSCSK